MEKTAIDRAVDAIIDDLCGRSQGDWFFEGCDKEIQQEIRETWAMLIFKELYQR